MTDLLLQTVDAFAARQLYPAAALIDATDEVPASIVDTMREIGIVGLGDDDADLPDVLRVVEALGAGSAAVALLVVAPAATTGTARARTGLRGLRSGVQTGCDFPAEHRRLALAAGAAAIGAARHALKETARYLEQRRAFGQVLIDVPVLAAALRGREADLDDAASALWGCARDPLLGRAPDVARRATRAAVGATFDAIQLHGGYGYTTEYQVERIARDCISLRALLAELDDVAAARAS
ncbi:hypothetical protein GCM10009547_28620 [Sporichthya brevicatena]|uniref:Acyl-CoA dehydrogenase n=1 Tax=Sporichthya brevicatena TaxID=171442 RepID=A0ABN1GYR8_9ACTN